MPQVHYQNMQVEGYNRSVENPNDYYATPVSLACFLIDQIEHILDKPLPLKILDVGSGQGVFGETVKKRYPHHEVWGIEFDEDIEPNEHYDHWVYGDVREWVPPDDIKFDLVIGNPPYGITGGKTDKRLAEKIVHLAHDWTTDKGVIWFLLKTVFIESKVRYDNLFNTTKKCPIFVMQLKPARVAWRPDEHGKNTNTVSYCAIMWDKFWADGHCKLTWGDWEDYRDGKVKYD